MEKDPHEAEQQHKLCTHINKMPPQVRDRFKALKVLNDAVGAIQEQQEKEVRLLRVKYQ